MDRLRIGLTQRVEDLPERGERRDALDQQWAALIEAQGWTPVAIPNRLADPAGFVDALDVALVVFTGGNDLGGLDGAVTVAPERDATETRLLDHLAQRRVPALGVCRGFQLMVMRAGGRLRPVADHVARPHGLELVGAPRWPIREGTVNSFHTWGVTPTDLGAGLDVLAVAADGTVEAVAHPDLPHVGVMWHPERSPADPRDIDLITALLEAR